MVLLAGILCESTIVFHLHGVLLLVLEKVSNYLYQQIQSFSLRFTRGGISCRCRCC